jgi:hypothetical protein
VFLGYSNLHKGYKCLDVANGRVYISRDVVFDEYVFPFSELNPNAGAQLKSDVMPLHPTLAPLLPLGNAVENHIINSHVLQKIQLKHQKFQMICKKASIILC